MTKEEMMAKMKARWENFYNNGGYLEILNCSFRNPDWKTCLTSKWWVVLGMAIPWAFLGWMEQMVSHWSFYAPVDAPEIEDQF